MRKNIKKIIVALILIPVLVGIIFLIWLNSIFGNKEPSDKRLKQLFETYTKSEFPKSGKISDKDYLSGLNDGWEAAIITVNDTTEFEHMLNSIEQKQIMTRRIRGKYGFGFSSKFASDKTILLDSIYYTNEGFILGYIKNKKIFLIEKDW
ncbi:hypothetical protein [Aestuariibaculum lutulentum]|uniref:Uncharacterized protein n=1 Tax=Aestuariibaculum lutulentum TaxID=2920935 RepID=A0ABS9RKS5_9FLAO|nr:hypothetical protein [Aestuariibaculum lutulentum]MCH4553554.1 hypothetical protein [Aestuariibaculum lutulentum]